MVRRRGRILSAVRDVVVTVFSVVIIGTSWGRWFEEPVFIILDALGAVFIVLSIVDVVLLVRRSNRKGVMNGMALAEVFISGFIALLFAPAALLLVLNLAVIAGLWERKTAEELAAHPPLPRTRNYKAVDGVGTLVMLASMFLPAISASDGSVSLFGFYSALLTHSGLPGVSVSQTAVVFALLAIVFSPVAVACGALGLVKRRASFAGGVLGVVAGVSMVVALWGAVGVGSYAMAAGGVVVLVASLGFRKR